MTERTGDPSDAPGAVTRQWRITHPALEASVSKHALDAAVGAAVHGDPAAWLDLLQAGFRYPDLSPGRTVSVEDIAVLVEFVSERVEQAAAVAVRMAEGLGQHGLDQPRSQRDVVKGLSEFIYEARRWVADARRHGPTAMVEPGRPSIEDASLPDL